MANGRFRLGKESGGTLGLVFPDGVSDTEVILPESGELATKDSPDLTGTPTAPTAAVDTNNNQIATTEFVKSVVASSGNVGGSVTFTASGTWTCPAGVYTAFVRVLGGGAGGGGKDGGGTNPSGGGGAAVENTALVKVTPGTVYTITIGAGGAGGSKTGNGGAGGNSSALGITGYGGSGGGRTYTAGSGKSAYIVAGGGGAGSVTPYSINANGSGASGGSAIWMNAISARAGANVAATLPGQGGGGTATNGAGGKAGFRGQVYICW